MDQPAAAPVSSAELMVLFARTVPVKPRPLDEGEVGCASRQRGACPWGLEGVHRVRGETRRVSQRAEFGAGLTTPVRVQSHGQLAAGRRGVVDGGEIEADGGQRVAVGIGAGGELLG